MDGRRIAGTAGGRNLEQHCLHARLLTLAMGCFMKSRMLMSVTVALLTLGFVSCPEPYADAADSGGNLSDSAFWFGEIHEQLLGRIGECSSDAYSGPTGNRAGQVAARSYVCGVINAKWGTAFLPAKGTENQAADCEFLLKKIDEANNTKTGFGSSTYAAKQLVDVDAVDQTLAALWVLRPRFVALALNQGKAAWSDDGETWTLAELPGDRAWVSAAYGGGTFIAFARNSDKVAWSVNGGVTWKEAELPRRWDWQGAAWGGGKFVVLAYNQDRAAWSSDGVTWNPAILPASVEWQSIAFGNGKFVAIAINSSKAAWSAGGEAWTETELPGNETWGSIAFGNRTFVAVDYGDSKAAWSADGEAWTTAELPDGMTRCSVAFGNGKFVAVSGYSENNKAAWSADGQAWTAVNLPVNGRWSSIAWGNGQFVVLADRDGKIVRSTDGSVWIPSTSSSLSDLPSRAGWAWQYIAFGE
jgi:hypothetical protein